MTFQSNFLDAIQAPFPSEEMKALPLFDNIPELKACDGLQQNPKHHKYDVLTHTFKVLDNIATKNPVLRIAALLHDIGKPECLRIKDNGEIGFKGHPAMGAQMADVVCKRLGLDTLTRQHICTLIENHGVDFRLKDEEKIKFLYMTLGEDFLTNLMRLNLADRLGSGYCTPTSYKILSFQKRLKGINNDIQKSYAHYSPIQKASMLPEWNP